MMLHTIQNPSTELFHKPIQAWERVKAKVKDSARFQVKERLLTKSAAFRPTDLVGRHSLATQQELQNQLSQLNAELDRAKAVQSIFYPRRVPDVAGLSIHAKSCAANQLSGDFYDFIVQPRDCLLFSVGDVSSKGAPAALLMPLIRRALRAGAKILTMPTPQALITYTNMDMYDELARSSMFATMFVGHFDPSSQLLRYVNAGQSPIIYRPYGGAARMLSANTVPVGVLAENTCTDQEIRLELGDLLIAGTDGIAEARNPVGALFGYTRILEFVDQVGDLSPQEITEELFARVERFSASSRKEDDQTLVVLKGG